jgi:hypothetical protein
MAPRKSVAIDLETAHRLKAQGIPTAEIARQLKLPVSTLKDQLKRTLPVKTTKVDIGGTTNVHNYKATEVHSSSSTKVHIDLPLADLADFHEMLAWWRRRKHLLAQANEAPAPTERWTLHIEKPFIQRIKVVLHR